MICENCENQHNGGYASGRFCSVKCSRGFSTKVNRKEIASKISKTLKNTGNPDVILKCNSCGSEFIICWSKRNQKNCSVSCSITKRNRDSVLSDDHKNNIKKGVLKNYENGKNVYGGRTKWYKYRDIKVQGTYELRTCHILDCMKNKLEIYDWEYTNDRIKYTDINGKNRSYLLDFKIHENENDFYYLETKGYVTPNDILKWEAARKRYRLDVWFKADIIEMEKIFG
jgi:hypothetical protein